MTRSQADKYEYDSILRAFGPYQHRGNQEPQRQPAQQKSQEPA